MQRYRNHNHEVEIEAVELTPQNAATLAAWCGGVQVEEKDPFDESKVFVGINVPTPDGWRRASEGDYIAHGDRGFDKWHAGIFEASFVKLEETPHGNQEAKARTRSKEAHRVHGGRAQTWSGGAEEGPAVSSRDATSSRGCCSEEGSQSSA